MFVIVAIQDIDSADSYGPYASYEEAATALEHVSDIDADGDYFFEITPVRSTEDMIEYFKEYDRK